MERINCLRCVHYYITWDRRFPRGCRVLDFKSRYLPSYVVFNSSGMPCQYYASVKQHKKERSSD